MLSLKSIAVLLRTAGALSNYMGLRLNPYAIPSIPKLQPVDIVAFIVGELSVSTTGSYPCPNFPATERTRGVSLSFGLSYGAISLTLETLKPLASEDKDGSFEAIGIPKEKRKADLERLEELVRRRKVEDGGWQPSIKVT